MKRWTGIILLAWICLLLSGCDFWLNGSYSSVTPNQGNTTAGNQEDEEIYSYRDLREAMEDTVEMGVQKVMFSASRFDAQTLESYMQRVTEHIITNNPVGNFAVEQISYDVGSSGGRQAIGVNITYSRTKAEILGMPVVADMDEAVEQIQNALSSCEASLVMRVQAYEQMDIVQMVQSYGAQNPHICVEIPQVSVSTYPESGIDRVVELSFVYKNSREVLRSMQQTVQDSFTAAQKSLKAEDTALAKIGKLYTYVMERHENTMGTSITPAYSVLRYGVGDSKAFAEVYAALGRWVGLDCETITGTRNGEAWCWNVICIEGTYYYLDLVQCWESQTYQLKTFDQMTGYVWDYSAYGEDGPPAGEQVPTEPTQETQTSEGETEGETLPQEPIPSEEATTPPQEPAPTEEIPTDTPE